MSVLVVYAALLGPVTPEDSCRLAVSLTTSCVVSVGVNAEVPALVSNCSGAASALPSLCSGFAWPNFTYSYLHTLMSAVTVSSTVESTVQTVYRVVYLSAPAPAAGCDPVIPGLRSTATGTVVSSVCPAMNGMACTNTGSTALVSTAAGMKFYPVAASPPAGYAAAASANTCSAP